MPQKKPVHHLLKLFGGYAEISNSDLFRLHLRIGAVTFSIESKRLYEATRQRRKETHR